MGYDKLDVNNFEKFNGFCPKLLTLLKKRIIMLANNALAPELDSAKTELIRGQAKEIKYLIIALERLGVVEHKED